eukprot:Filipodium_phascolosomae@DN1326_c0_g1_i1.p1
MSSFSSSESIAEVEFTQDIAGTIHEPDGFDPDSTIVAANFPNCASDADVFNYFAWIGPVIHVEAVRDEAKQTRVKKSIPGAFVVVFADERVARLINASELPWTPPGSISPSHNAASGEQFWKHRIIRTWFVSPRPSWAERTWATFKSMIKITKKSIEDSGESDVEDLRMPLSAGRLDWNSNAGAARGGAGRHTSSDYGYSNSESESREGDSDYEDSDDYSASKKKKEASSPSAAKRRTSSSGISGNAMMSIWSRKLKEMIDESGEAFSKAGSYMSSVVEQGTDYAKDMIADLRN